MNAFYWALSDMKRNKGFLALFILSFACACIMLSMIFTQFHTAYQERTVANRLIDENITAFHIEYKTQGMTQVFGTDDLAGSLNKGYSIIEQTSETYSDMNYLYMIGDPHKTNVIPSDIQLQSHDVFIGYDWNEEQVKERLRNDDIVFHRIMKLQKDSTLLTSQDIKRSLNKEVLIYLEMKDLDRMYISTDEICGGLLMMDATKQEVTEFVNQINKGKEFTIAPYDYVKEHKVAVESMLQGSIFYFFIFSACFLVFLIMMLVNNALLVDMKVKEYTIHIAYGATKRDIMTRILLIR